MEWLHLTLVDLLPILIALHIGAILLYKLKGKPLVKAMITGKQTKTIKETSVAEQKLSISHRKAVRWGASCRNIGYHDNRCFIIRERK